MIVFSDRLIHTERVSTDANSSLFGECIAKYIALYK